MKYKRYISLLDAISIDRGEGTLSESEIENICKKHNAILFKTFHFPELPTRPETTLYCFRKINVQEDTELTEDGYGWMV